MDYGKPEPHAQPIIAPDEDSDKRAAKGLTLPARPNWLCINDPKNLSVPAATMAGYLTHPKKLSEAEKQARKRERDRERDARRKAKAKAHKKAIAEARREREKIRAKKAKEKAKAKKTPEEIRAMRLRQAEIMRKARAESYVKRAPDISPDRIKMLLARARLTRRQLGALLGVSETSVDSYCAGHGMNPKALERFKALEKSGVGPAS